MQERGTIQTDQSQDDLLIVEVLVRFGQEFEEIDSTNSSARGNWSPISLRAWANGGRCYYSGRV